MTAQLPSSRSAAGLDGIPLAIELAASRMLSMTVTEVRDRLDDRFRLLVGSRRGLERHQTLRHAVQWSYELLDDAEKILLNRCSVFAGGFDLASACAVTGADDEVPFDIPSELGGIYILKGDPNRWIVMCRTTIAGSADAHILTRAHLVMSLAMIGATDEAIEASEPLRNADSVTQNPAFVSWALLSYGYVRHNTDPDSAFEAHRLGAKDCAGNRQPTPRDVPQREPVSTRSVAP